MARKVELTRDEAELLVDLLMLSDDWKAFHLGLELRNLFGMASEEKQLAAMGKTLEEFRREFSMAMLAPETEMR